MKKTIFLVIVIIIIIISFVLINNNKNDTIPVMKEDNIPKDYLKDNMFSMYKEDAYNKLKSMTLDEKIGQILLVRYPIDNEIEDMKKYKFGGYLFFSRDFKDKTKKEVINMISSLQKESSIPLITAVDEEGGEVVRISSNKNLRDEPFKSSRQLYEEGGLDKIKKDTKEKNKLLKELGINMNLAPVVDVSTDENDYIYERSLGRNAKITSEYAKTVIKASKNSGVSYALKHFPGYGNNSDTHSGVAVDSRTIKDLENKDLIPFKEGIKAGSEAVLISHNILKSIDSDNQASLSLKVHNILIDKLGFKGIIITDDLDMGAINGDYKDIMYKAVTSGNTLIIVTDYEESINSIKELINDKKIDEELINKLAFKIICWKYYKKLF